MYFGRIRISIILYHLCLNLFVLIVVLGQTKRKFGKGAGFEIFSWPDLINKISEFFQRFHEIFNLKCAV